MERPIASLRIGMKIGGHIAKTEILTSHFSDDITSFEFSCSSATG